MTVSPLRTEGPNRWAKKIQDIIADSSNLREGLSDEEAMPLIDWGVERAVQLGDRLSQPDHADLTEEQVEDIGYALVRLMTRIAWLVVYRNEKDAEWLTRTFNKVNDLSQELDGPGAPMLLEEEITTWNNQHVMYSNSQLINDLITRLTPVLPSGPTKPTLLSSILTADGTTKPVDSSLDEPPKPITPLSSILDANGTIKKSPDSPPSSQGELPDDQEKNL